MAQKNAAEKDKFQEQADELREDIEKAYAFVEGQRFTQSAASMTPEDAMDRFIERISGKDTEARPNVLNRIKSNQARLEAAIAKIKKMPPEAFRQSDASKDVNTKK